MLILIIAAEPALREILASVMVEAGHEVDQAATCEGVLAVDMESAAMLSVAKSMNLPAMAVFSIADQLSGGEWRMANDLRPAQKGLSILFDAAFELLFQR